MAARLCIVWNATAAEFATLAVRAWHLYGEQISRRSGLEVWGCC